MKELQDEVLETISDMHLARLCGHCRETDLLYSSYKSCENPMVLSGC